MDEEHQSRSETPVGPIDDGEGVDVPVATTRRAFLAGVGRKTAYATPVLLTLTASPAMASGFSASCKPQGKPCTRNLSCCSDDCDTGGTNTCNCAAAGKPCGADGDCCSASCGVGQAGLCD